MLEKRDYLSKDEQKQLLSFWKTRARLNRRGKRTYAFIKFAIDTGLRAGEIASTKVSSLELGRYPALRVKTLKNGMDSIVYLSDSLAKCLKRYIREERLKTEDYLFRSERRGQASTTSLWYRWKHSLEKAGLPHYRLHSSRHTAGYNLYTESKNLRLVQKVLRHKSIQSTVIYSDVSPEEIYSVMNRI